MPQRTQKNPPPPPPPPPPALTWPPVGISEVAPPDARPADVLAGHWVTSFTCWQMFNPLPVRDADETPDEFAQRVAGLPPQIGGYGWTPPKPYDPDKPGSYYQREGYFLCAALVRITLDGYGRVTAGVMEFIRGGRGYKRRILAGSYMVRESPELPGSFEGTITETHESDGPEPTTFTYAFVLRDLNSLDWIWKQGSYRPMVASGTFKRIRLHYI